MRKASAAELKHKASSLGCLHTSKSHCNVVQVQHRNMQLLQPTPGHFRSTIRVMPAIEFATNKCKDTVAFTPSSNVDAAQIICALNAVAASTLSTQKMHAAAA
jgi:hypothetical protein